MADVPVPGSELSDEAAVGAAIPPPVHQLMAALWGAGHAAYIVGGSLRDVLLGRVPFDWDLATDARPNQILRVFTDAVYENAFGTVVVRHAGQLYEVTTFRTDHDYTDFRRPHRVEFGNAVEVDLARRDFTANAVAWGARAGDQPDLVDPHGGRADIAARTLRAVGDPKARFEEDALRMVRAVRLAATLGFTIEPATLAGIEASADLVRYLSAERIQTELSKLIASERPSVGLRLLADTGLLERISPDLARQRGVPQNKVPGEDLWDHTLRSVDAVSQERPVVRLAALLHDIGKPATFSDGHFLHHDVLGAELAATLLDELRFPRAVRERVVHLVRHHMFSYEPAWSDAAVRRFIGKIGTDALDDLFTLREADNLGSGLAADAGGLDVLRGRVTAELEGELVLDRSKLQIDGSDLIEELGLRQGPQLGRILDELLEKVIVDPALNDRATLLMLARSRANDA
ncbi:MAG TPA: HD domain-containing protein [Candidatus Limnocylindrales bacterium]|nr:HD domain-containing protein [Candidatus Limnocylindrales bacterium]